MQNWKTAVLTLAIFGLGALAGSLVSAQIIRGRLAGAKAVTPAPPTDQPEWPAKMADSMRKQLDLNPEQSRAVAAILRQTHEDIQRMRERWRKDLRQRMIESDRALESQLKTEQRKRWDEFRKRRRSEFFAPRVPGARPQNGERPARQDAPPAPPRETPATPAP